MRTIDVYSVVPPGFDTAGTPMDNPVAGSAEDIAGFVAELGRLGFSEVRFDLSEKTPAAVEAMAPVVEMVHVIGDPRA